MQTTLELDKTRCQCTSTWEGYNSGTDVTPYYEYTTPTYDYDNIKITVPAALVGCTFNSVNISYNVSNTSGTKKIVYSDTRETVTNSNLLSRLRSGNTTTWLLFSFKANGGSGGNGSHSSTCYWTNFSVTITYTPAAGVTGSITITNGGTVQYSVDKASLAKGESTTVSLYISSRIAMTSVRADVMTACGTQTITNRVSKSIAAGSTGSVSFTLTLTEAFTSAMTDRAGAAKLKITLSGSAGSFASAYVTISSFMLLKERLAPVISDVVWTESATDHLMQFGGLVQGYSIPQIAFSVALDTVADSSISIGSRSISIEGKTYSSATNSAVLKTIGTAGDVTFTISVTDSYGKTGIYTGNVNVLAYTKPVLQDVDIVRYVTGVDSQGNPVYEADDDGTSVWFDAQVIVQTQLGTGTNTWCLSINNDTVVTDSSDANVIYIRDKTLITGAYDNTEEHRFTIVLSDQISSAKVTVIVPRSGGIFNIEATGVAVGKRSTGTHDEPLFEVAYPAHFTGGAYDENGNRLGGVKYVLPETKIGTFLGKALYRKGVQVSSFPTSAGTINMGITPTRITKIEGFVKSDSYGDLPLNCYHSTTIRVFTRPDGLTGKLIAYAGCANKGAVIFVEYTKN